MSIMDNSIRQELRDYAGREITFRALGQRSQKLLGRKAVDSVMDALVIGAMDMRTDIVMSMRNSPATGNLYFRRWSKKGKAIYHRASSPGNPPRPDTARLINSMVVDVRFAEVEIGSNILNPAYPKWLEEGTKEMDARPWLQPAINRNRPRINMAVRRRLREIAGELSR